MQFISTVVVGYQGILTGIDGYNTLDQRLVARYFAVMATISVSTVVVNHA